MQRNILLFTLGIMVLHGQPAVTNLVVDDNAVNGGHSSFRVTWNTDVAPDNQRVDWGPTNAYGRVLYAYQPSYAATGQQLTVSGLNATTDMDAGRVVHFRACSHNGSGWGCSSDQTVTIPAVPSPHPVVATLPETFSIPQPSEAGCTTQTAASDLSDLQAKINTAASNQVSACQVVIIPAGAVGTAFVTIPTAVDADKISSYNTGSNVLTVVTRNNTYSNGDRVRVANNTPTYATIPTGLQSGADYCASSVSGSTLQLTAWPSCTGVVSLGTAGTGQFNIMPFPPRHSNYITVRSNGVYPPDGVRTGPGWQAASNTAQWQPTITTATTVTSPYGYNSLLFSEMAHHWYIGPGIDFTAANSNQSDTTDPAPWPLRIVTKPSNSYIAVKRNWITGLGYPERQYVPMYWDGSYVDFADNYLTGIDYWRPARLYSDFAQTPAGAVLSVGGGFYNTGIGNCPSVGASSVTLTSSTSGIGYVTVRPSDCAVIATLPSGTTATCSGCTTAVGADWPKNGAGQYTHGLVASCTFTTGSWTSCTSYDDINASLSQYFGGGSLQIISSYGPGPMRYSNNYEESHGILYHMDDSGANNYLTIPSNVTIQRNLFNTLAKYRYGSAQNNGLVYPNRQAIECKRCNKVLIKGNEITGGFRDFQNDGPSILVSSIASACTAPCIFTSGDVSITSNYIHDTSGGIETNGNFQFATVMGPMARRYTVTNNLLANINGYVYRSTLYSNTIAHGPCFLIWFGGEDVIVDHNTCYSAAGNSPAVVSGVSKMVEGFKFTNNAVFVNDDNGLNGVALDWGGGGTGSPNCSLLKGTAGISCFANGVYNWSNNLLIPGYTNSQTMSGDSKAADWVTSWRGSTNTWIPTDSTVAARVAGSRWDNPSSASFQFTQSSPYISGGPNRATDDTDIGANQPGVQDALGWVLNVRTPLISSSGFTAAFHAPDPSTACYVGYGTSSDPTTWSQTEADTSATQERTIQVTGLTSETTYYFQIWCSQSAPTTTSPVRTL